MQNIQHIKQVSEYTERDCLPCEKACCVLRNVHAPAAAYGGNQDWFGECSQDRYSALRACGIIALLNQFASLGIAYPDAQALWPDDGLPESKEDYVSWAYTLKPYIWPGPFGLPKGDSIRKASRAFAADRGLELTWHNLYGRPSIEEEISFIRAGLQAHVPVSHLVWRSKFEDLTWHWIAITGLEIDPQGCDNLTPELRSKYQGELFVICSNFGKKEAYPIRLLRKAFPFHRELQYPTVSLR